MTATERLADAAAAVARSAAARPAVRALGAVTRPRPGRFAVLTYHRVAWPAEAPDLHPGLISATPTAFASQMRWLAEHRPVVALADLLAAAEGGPLPAGAVLITFDDGYRDLAQHAWPILRSLGLPATLFVPTGFPGREVAFWWDRLAAAILQGEGAASLISPIGALERGDQAQARASLRRVQAWLKTRPHAEVLGHVDDLAAQAGLPPPRGAVLDWPELRALAADGLTIAPHTVNHPLLTKVPPATAVQEIAGSLADLERELGPTAPALAYPSGAFDSQVMEAAQAAGLRLAFTTQRGPDEVATLAGPDRLRLRRINVGGRSSPALIEAQLLAWLGGRR
ncbi:MAG TPA: polysaccharide deacetylase family protein [Candidatus Limnocylindrales bacterium]|nr:polysaccharide deacetylase family protein [Candidatus Limnocylindrales bacterium]